jgi:cation diffusion facilitator CzcD-associated flavoprotein CzcO
MSVTDSETLIVGAGPAGLACAASLKALGRSALVLEKGESLADSWHRHYDRLHLHTHKKHSGLPGKPMPRGFPKFPSRLQVIEYLEDYASNFNLDIKYCARVTSIRKYENWTVATDDTTFAAQKVIVATGMARTPSRPNWKGQELYSGRLVHSSQFRNAAELKAKRVLVVGFGNSAGEIALECGEAGLDVGLSVRSRINVIPREMFGLPTLSIAIAQQYIPYRWVDTMNAPLLRLRFGDISKFGLEWSQQGPLTTIMEKGRTPWQRGGRDRGIN